MVDVLLMQALLKAVPDKAANVVDLWRRAASYVNRILRGAKPAELPIQLPTKFRVDHQSQDREGPGLTIPETLLASADEVIQ
jgi:putative tryptophan/tyrosine transport system substrate-binding protein